MPHSRLEDLILTAFIRAQAENRSDVAEYLLRALEALCPGVPTDESRLARAYRELAREGSGANDRTRKRPRTTRRLN